MCICIYFLCTFFWVSAPYELNNVHHQVLDILSSDCNSMHHPPRSTHIVLMMGRQALHVIVPTHALVAGSPSTWTEIRHIMWAGSLQLARVGFITDYPAPPRILHFSYHYVLQVNFPAKVFKSIVYFICTHLSHHQ